MLIQGEIIKVVKAEPKDLGRALSILSETKKWTERHGNQMWSEDDVSEDVIRELIDEGALHLAKVDGETVGTVAYQEEDAVYWPEVDDDNSAFLHRLAIKPDFAGQGLGEEILDWAEKKAESEGKEYLRLDCVASRTKLCNYYERQGFEKKGVRWIEMDQADAALFVKELPTEPQRLAS